MERVLLKNDGMELEPGRSPFIAWLHPLLGALALLMVSMCARAADPAAMIEYKVKTGYLFNFAKFIEWPATCLPAPDSPFVIGVLDDGEVVPVLQSLLEGKKVDSHPVQVKVATIDQIGKGFHILFVSRAAGKSPEEVKAALGNAATLLVGETEQFAERGGTLGFTLEEQSIRLSLNLERATESGLKVSSKLSSVAKLVKTRKNK